jgi:galactokinase
MNDKQLVQLAEAKGLDINGGRVRRSSSRFCLGIEHGDYNGLELFGVGTDRFIWLAFKPNTLGRIRIYSENFPEDGTVEVALQSSPDPATVADSWARFPHGVGEILRSHGCSLTTGFDAVVYGNIPGGGMSRSASLTLNLLATVLEVNRIDGIEGMEMVNLAQRVENDYIGSPCGKLDQIMIYYAKAGMGTFFDPVAEKIEHIPFGGDAESFRLVSLDTGTKRPGLEKSTYKVRRSECDTLNAYLNQQLGKSVAAITTPADYAQARSLLDALNPDFSQRLKYLYEARMRFQQTLRHWREGAIAAIGANFRADGIGLRDDYQISGPELETMCDIARTVEGVYGERMLGGGDKGAAGAIVHRDALPALEASVRRAYPLCHPAFAQNHAVHGCRSVDGLFCRALEPS